MIPRTPYLVCPQRRDCSVLDQFNARLEEVIPVERVETDIRHPDYQSGGNTSHVESYGGAFSGSDLAGGTVRNMTREMEESFKVKPCSPAEGHCVAARLLIDNTIGNAGHLSRVHIRPRLPQQPATI